MFLLTLRNTAYSSFAEGLMDVDLDSKYGKNLDYVNAVKRFAKLKRETNAD